MQALPTILASCFIAASALAQSSPPPPPSAPLPPAPSPGHPVTYGPAPQPGSAPGQNGNAFAPRGNVAGQNGNAFVQNGNAFAQNGNVAAQNANTPARGHATAWQHVTAANNVDLSWSTSVETTAAGQQPFVYLRLENHNPYAVEGALGVDATCKSGATIHVGFDESAVGVLNPGETFGGFPHLYRAVCKPGDSVERVSADLRFVPLDPTHVQAPPEPEPNWIPDHIPEPEPLPDFTQGAQVNVGEQRPGQFPQRAPPPTSSRGTMVEVRYGLSVLAIPLQGVTVNRAGFTSDYHKTAGGLGPRIGLNVWPFYSRWFSVGIEGLLDFDTIGLSNGFSYAADLAGGLVFQGGDERFLSGVLKIREGYRNAQSSAGDSSSEEESDGSFSGNYARFAADARLCVDGAHPVGACSRGADLGFGYDVLGYAGNHGGWFVEGAFWMRHHFSVALEVGWDYAAGGVPAIARETPWHNTYVSVGLQFSDMFWNGY